MSDFQRFWALSYRRLVPIIPPDADISERSTLHKRIGTKQDGRGKTPGTRGRDGKWSSFDWAAHEADESDLPRWEAMQAGVGIKTGRQPDGTWLVPIDADTLDVQLATIIRDVVDTQLHRPAVRVGRSPKAMYIVRVSGPLPYQRIEFGDERVEVLSDGKQFVADGVHPFTGKPYSWPRELPPYEQLPVYEPAQVTQVLEQLRGLLPAATRVIVEGVGNDVSQAALTGPVEAVRKAVAATPNTSNTFPSRESYRDMGYAIKAALPDNEPEAFELFAEWCARWVEGENDPDVVAADWRRMKGPFRRGASWLYEQAETFGDFDRSSVWFEIVPETAPNPFAEVEATAASSTALTPIKWVRPSEWTDKKPPPREWEVEGWIPRYEVTLLYGDGGIGKTLVVHQYATAAAAGLPWLGQPTRKARVMCFFCEDSEDELLRRQIDINASMGVSFADTDENLRIASRKYMDNLLILWDRNTGAMKRQAVWEQLRSDAIAFGAEVLVVDTIADTFGGNEIDRGQVNAFVKSCLGRLAQEIGGSVIALGHPSLSGKASGSGTSGSTAWSNAVRSRLYLRYPKGVEKGNVRELEGMKLNYGPKGNLLKLRWHRGAFDVVAATVALPASDTPAAGLADGVPPTIESATDDLVFAAVQACAGVPLNMKSNSPHYAPRVLKRREPDLLGELGNDDVAEALGRLEARGVVKAGEVGRDVYRRPIQGYSVGLIEAVEADSMSGSVFE